MRRFLGNIVKPGCGQFRIRRGLVFAGVASILLSGQARAADPTIYKIDLFSTNHVLIHFDTAANRTYELQFLNTLACPTNMTTNGMACSSNNVPVGTWQTLFLAEATIFPNHYVVPDTRSTPHRFYRLRVTR